MSDTDVLETVQREDIDAAFDRWKGGDDATRGAVLTGREVALVNGVSDAETLVGLRRAVEEGPSSVMELASLIARVLVARDETAFSLIDELATSPAAQGRIGALLCLPPSTPDDRTRPILRALLGDRSKRVREMAVDWIRRNDLKRYLPMLEALLVSESNQALKGFIAREISLLKDGYYIHREPGSVHVTIKTIGGSYGGFMNPKATSGLSDREIADRFASMNR